MKSFRIEKNGKIKNKKGNLFFWLIFLASTLIVCMVIFYYYQDTIRVIEAQSNDEIFINLPKLKK